MWEKKPAQFSGLVIFLNLEFELTLPTNSSPKGLLSVKNSELAVFRAIYAETSSQNFCSVLLYQRKDRLLFSCLLPPLYNTVSSSLLGILPIHVELYWSKDYQKIKYIYHLYNAIMSHEGKNQVCWYTPDSFAGICLGITAVGIILNCLMS